MSAAGDFADLMRRFGRALGTDETKWRRFLDMLPPLVKRRLKEEFPWQAHGGQQEPAACADGSEWRVWLLMAGRGFGKTRAGAEWVSARAREIPGARIALVGGSRDEAAKVMVEGPSGLLAVARSDEALVWTPTNGVVRFSSGAEAFVYSGAAPEKLRGPEHHFAWCDELAKWKRPDETWDNLQMGMRLGTRPRLIVTATPKPVAIVRRVRALSGTVETRGRTAENEHVAEAFQAWAMATYGGTRLGRQELDGELFEEVEGALWTREMIERSRQSGTLPRLKRVLVGVDPPASAEGDACGIVVCGTGEDGIAYVLADRSVAGLRPEGWARAVCQAAGAWDADKVIAEKNQGGDMVESVLRSVEAGLPVKLVSASRGKAARAEPVAALFEIGQAKLAGRFPALEDEMAGLTYAGGYEGPGGSPDRADAMVWAMTELMKPEARPAVRML
jgi:phage terminase large subunit-like protein